MDDCVGDGFVCVVGDVDLSVGDGVVVVVVVVEEFCYFDDLGGFCCVDGVIFCFEVV